MQDCSLYLWKAKLLQKICKRGPQGPQSSEMLGQKFQWIFHLGKFALVKILEGTLLITVVMEVAVGLSILKSYLNNSAICASRMQFKPILYYSRLPVLGTPVVWYSTIIRLYL